MAGDNAPARPAWGTDRTNCPDKIRFAKSGRGWYNSYNWRSLLRRKSDGVEFLKNLYISAAEYDYHTLLKVAEMAGLAGIVGFHEAGDGYLVSFPDGENERTLPDQRLQKPPEGPGKQHLDALTAHFGGIILLFGRKIRSRNCAITVVY